MNQILFGVLVGTAAGIIDVIPMFLQKLPWQADLSAFLMWGAVGFLVSTSNLKINGVLKGLLIAFIVLAPAAVLIGGDSPASLIPVTIMTAILGSLVGYITEKGTN